MKFERIRIKNLFYFFLFLKKFLKNQSSIFNSVITLFLLLLSKKSIIYLITPPLSLIFQKHVTVPSSRLLLPNVLFLQNLRIAIVDFFSGVVDDDDDVTTEQPVEEDAENWDSGGFWRILKLTGWIPQKQRWKWVLRRYQQHPCCTRHLKIFKVFFRKWKFALKSWKRLIF